MSFAVRPARDEEAAELAALHRRVFASRMSEDAWRWKHGCEGDGTPGSWVAEEGGRILGHYGAEARRLAVAGRTFPARVAFDAMTAPDARRRGVLTNLARTAHAAWAEAGTPVVLGMPNEQYGSRREALGWRPAARLVWRLRPLAPERLLARRLGWPALARLGAAGRLWNALWDAGRPRSRASELAGPADAARLESLADEAFAPPEGGPTLLTSRSRLERRFLRAVDPPYRMAIDPPHAWVAWRLPESGEGRIGAIGELSAPSRRRGAALARRAAEDLRRAGAHLAIALATPGSRTERALLSAGFVASWARFDVQAVLLDPELSRPLTPGTRPGAPRWRLSGGDFDLV